MPNFNLSYSTVPDSLYCDDPGPIVPMVNSSESKRSRVILFTDRQTDIYERVL